MGRSKGVLSWLGSFKALGSAGGERQRSWLVSLASLVVISVALVALWLRNDERMSVAVPMDGSGRGSAIDGGAAFARLPAAGPDPATPSPAAASSASSSAAASNALPAATAASTAAAANTGGAPRPWWAELEPELLEGLTATTWPTPPPTAPKHKSVISIAVFLTSTHRDATGAPGAGTTAPLYVLNKYTFPLVNVILNWKWLLPEWGVRVHVPREFPLINQLRALGAEVVEMDFDQNRWSAAMTWRFLAEDDTGLECWASREAESPPTYQDAAALRTWQQKRPEAQVMVMHIRPQHRTWNGGTWAARRGFISKRIGSSMADAINAFSRTYSDRLFGSRYGDDQGFMHSLWRPLQLNVNGIAYGSDAVLEKNKNEPCYLKSCEPWPPYPGRPDGFEASLNFIYADQLILCHFREPPYCRKVKYNRHEDGAWRDLFELCVRHDFFSGRPLTDNDLIVQKRRLELDGCPYHGVAPLDF